MVVAALVWAVRPGRAQVAGPDGKPVRVAVVNLMEVSETCKRTQDLRATLEKQGEEKLKAVRALRDRLKKAQDDLAVLVKGSPAWRKQNAEVLRLEVESRILGELSDRELRAENLQYTTEIYQSIVTAVEAYAKANRIDLVLRVGQEDIESSSLQELFRKTALQSVLYAAPALDITAEVRRAVDRAYESEKAGP